MSDLWDDGTPRSNCNAFTHGFGERIDTRALQISENRRRGSSQGLDTRRAAGPQGSTKAARLRLALEAGPMSSRELSAVTGIAMDLVPSLLQWSVSTGQIKVSREGRPYRYYLSRSYSPSIEGAAAGQASTDKRSAIRRGGI